MEISHKVSHTFDWKSNKSNGVLPNHWKDLVIYTPCVDFLAFTITSNDAEEHNLKVFLMNMGHGSSTTPAGKWVVTIRAWSPCDSMFTSDSKHWGVKEGAGLYPVCRTRWLPVHGSIWSFLWCPQTNYGEWPHTSYLPGFPTLTVEFCSLTAQQFSLSASHNIYDLSLPASLPSSQLMLPLPPTAHAKRPRFLLLDTTSHPLLGTTMILSSSKSFIGFSALCWDLKKLFPNYHWKSVFLVVSLLLLYW